MDADALCADGEDGTINGPYGLFGGHTQDVFGHLYGIMQHGAGLRAGNQRAVRVVSAVGESFRDGAQSGFLGQAQDL